MAVKLGEEIKRDFPIFDRWQKDHGEPLIYLDNAATTQKPQAVITAMTDFYESANANVHRGMYHLSQVATDLYEQARERVRSFIGARSAKEIIFTRGTTDGINQIAQMLTERVTEGSDIIISAMEHHSNIIPWQQLAQKKKAHLKYVEITDEGLLDLDHFEKMLSPKTAIVSLTHVSNALGTINPVKKIAEMVRQTNALFIVDGAQAVPHFPVDVTQIDADFYVFSGHKILGPTGIGVIYGKEKYLEQLSPADFGGEMISRVDDYDSSWADLPHKFEAGTPPIAEAIGLGHALDYLRAIGWEQILCHHKQLLSYTLQNLQMIDGLTLYGPEMNQRIGNFSFTLAGVHPHDLATALDINGVAIRSGHHCAQPLMRRLKVPATARISLYLYNTQEDIDRCMEAIIQTKEFFDDFK